MASGGLLVQIALTAPPAQLTAPFTGQIVGFTSADSDIGPLSIDGTNSVLFQHGYLSDSVTAANSGDISGGRGFMASAIEGELSLTDYCPAAGWSISRLISDGLVNVIGANVVVASMTSLGVVTRLVEYVVTGFDSADGGIRLTTKSRPYVADQSISVTKTVTQTLTGPDDPMAPTDPLSLRTVAVAQTAGRVFGGIDVSVQAPQPLDLCAIAYYKESTHKTGDITTTGTSADEVTIYASEFIDGTTGTVSPYFGTNSCLVFWCKGGSIAEANRFYAALGAYEDAGYHVTVTNGDWTLDLTSMGLALKIFTVNTGGGTPRYALIAVLDSVVGGSASSNPPARNAETKPLFPAAGLTASDCYFCAVPQNLPVVGGEVLVTGYAIESGAIPASGLQSYASGITSILPATVAPSGVIAPVPVRGYSLQFLPAERTPWLGAICEIDGNSTVTITGAGNIEAVATDPASPWDGVSTPVSIGGTKPGTGQIRVHLNAAPSGIDERGLMFAESTWVGTFTVSSIYGDGAVFPYAIGPLEPLPTNAWGKAVVAGQVFTFRNTARKAPETVNWHSTFTTMAEAEAFGTPSIGSLSTAFAHPSMAAVNLDIMECFLFSVKTVPLSGLYAVVDPFWTKGNCDALAVNGSLISSPANGLGTIAIDGSITWTPTTFPAEAGAIQVSGVAYGGGKWVAVGTVRVGMVPGNCYWTSTDGLTWVKATFGTTTNATTPTRCRYLNSLFVVTLGDGTVLTSPAATISWTTRAAGTGVFNDATYASSKYFLAGTGKVISTTAFSSYVNVWTGSGTALILCATVFGTKLFVGLYDGSIYSTPHASPGTWTLESSTGGQQITEMVATPTGLACVSPAAGIWDSRGAGVWTKRAGDDWLVRIGSGAFWIGAIASAVVGGAEILVYGSTRQIATSVGTIQSTTGPEPVWVPWATQTPMAALEHVRGRFLGGLGANANPLRWSYGGGAFDPIYTAFAVAFDPPNTSQSGTDATISAVGSCAKICEEWWIFGGEMGAVTLDGSTDAIRVELPKVNIGNVQDVACEIDVKFAPFGGSYTKTAYIKNVDSAYVAGNDSFYFSGWGTEGAAIWATCRAAYLATGTKRHAELSYDSIHDETTLGTLWTTTDADIGRRIDWLCGRPRYLTITISGNDSAAAKAFSGCRYKPNQTILSARGLTITGTGYGMVVAADHDYVGAEHRLTVAFQPTNIVPPPYREFDGLVGAISLGSFLIIDSLVGAISAGTMDQYDYPGAIG